MIIKIEDKEMELNFGIGFVRELDKHYFVKNDNGVRFGLGVETIVPLLLANDICSLSEAIYCGTYKQKKRPTQEQVDEYIDGVEDITAVFKEVMDCLKKQNATRLKVEEMERQMKRQIAEMNAVLKRK